MKRRIESQKLHISARWALTALFAIASISVGHAQLVAAQASWSQTYHDSGHTGYNTQETTLGVGNVASLQLLWASGVAGGVTNFAVADGVVYAMGQSNNLVALNATTGAQLWTTDTGENSGTNSIAVGGRLVFAECGAANSTGGICAYRTSNGKMVWQFAISCNCLPPARVSAPLVYSNGVLYFGYSSGGTTSTTGLYAVDAATGVALWFSLSEFNNGWSVSTAAVGGSEVYVDGNNYSNGQMYALASSSGNQIWATPINGGGNTALSVSGGVVYASTEWTGTNATFYGLNATTGAQLWSYTYATENWCGSAELPSPPAIAKGLVYFQGVDLNLYALHTQNGALKWADTPNTSPCGADGFRSSPSIANGVLYISGGTSGNAAPNTTAYNASTGALLWASPSGHGTLYTPPVVVNGVLYLASPGDSICQSICAYSVP
jgi:outer membrane protein assembly factor BamB